MIQRRIFTQIVLLSQIAHVKELLVVNLEVNWLAVKEASDCPGNQRSPNHSLCDENASGPAEVAKGEAIAQWLQEAVIAVLSLHNVGPVSLYLGCVQTATLKPQKKNKPAAKSHPKAYLMSKSTMNFLTNCFLRRDASSSSAE